MRTAHIRVPNTLATNLSQILGFADDLYLVGRTQTEVEEVFTSLVTEAATLGLKINIEKTKYMSSNRATNQQQNEFVNVPSRTLSQNILIISQYKVIILLG